MRPVGFGLLLSCLLGACEAGGVRADLAASCTLATVGIEFREPLSFCAERMTAPDLAGRLGEPCRAEDLEGLLAPGTRRVLLDRDCRPLERRAEADARAFFILGLVFPFEHAGKDDVDAVPKVGPGLANRVVDARNKAGVRNLSELPRVRGLGPKTLDLLGRYLY